MGNTNPHLHLFAHRSGWDHPGHQWVHLDYLPYAMLRKKWQWHLLTMLRQTVETKETHRLVDACLQALSRRVCDERAKGRCAVPVSKLGNYLAKYVVSPPNLAPAH